MQARIRRSSLKLHVSTALFVVVDLVDTSGKQANDEHGSSKKQCAELVEALLSLLVGCYSAPVSSPLLGVYFFQFVCWCYGRHRMVEQQVMEIMARDSCYFEVLGRGLRNFSRT